MQYLILCRSLTNAQRASLLLERRGIRASVVKAPLSLRGNGCGYAVSLWRNAREALVLLEESGLLSGRVYRRGEDGVYTEVTGRDLS